MKLIEAVYEVRVSEVGYEPETEKYPTRVLLNVAPDIKKEWYESHVIVKFSVAVLFKTTFPKSIEVGLQVGEYPSSANTFPKQKKLTIIITKSNDKKNNFFSRTINIPPLNFIIIHVNFLMFK